MALWTFFLLNHPKQSSTSKMWKEKKSKIKISGFVSLFFLIHTILFILSGGRVGKSHSRLTIIFDLNSFFVRIEFKTSHLEEILNVDSIISMSCETT